MKLLSFGEILYDVFGEQKTLGGAPLNVSYHFHKCGGDSSVISAVGDDELGRDALSVMKRNGIGTEHVALSSFPTGRADVVMNGNEADYVFNHPCGWDDIRLTSALLRTVDVFYWGTLALRSNTSHETWRIVSSSVDANIRYFDVNIRKEFYTESIIREGLESCSILKVNENELPLVLSLSDSGSVSSLMRKYAVNIVILTEGENGSVIFTEGGEYRIPPREVTVLDTVGAGDSYSASFLYNYLKSGDAVQSAVRASVLSAFVCTKRGGMPAYEIDCLPTLSDS